jgi:hypothetical protein
MEGDIPVAVQKTGSSAEKRYVAAARRQVVAAEQQRVVAAERRQVAAEQQAALALHGSSCRSELHRDSQPHISDRSLPTSLYTQPCRKL